MKYGIHTARIQMPTIKAMGISFFFWALSFFLKKPVFESAVFKGRYKIRVRAEFIKPFKRLKGKNTGRSMALIASLGTFI